MMKWSECFTWWFSEIRRSLSLWVALFWNSVLLHEILKGTPIHGLEVVTLIWGILFGIFHMGVLVGVVRAVASTNLGKSLN